MDFLPLLDRQAQRYAAKRAFVFRDASVSFAELARTAKDIAAALSRQGVSRGAKVAVFLPNIPEYIFSFLGIFLLRGVCVPLDYMLTEEEIVHFLNHSEATLLIAQERKGVELRAVKERCPRLRSVVACGQAAGAAPDTDGLMRWEGFLRTGAVLPAVDTVSDRDAAAIFYTSGTTGKPKGVVLDYGHLQNPIDTFRYFLTITDHDVLLGGGVPFSHLGGLDFVLLMLSFGVTLVLMERFQPLEFLKNIETHRATIFCIVPSMYVAILSLKEYDRFDLSSLRYAVVFGAPSSPALLERFHTACPNAYLLNGWGMTETAAPNTYLPTGTQTKEIPHTGTFPPGTEAMAVDEEGRAVRDGKEGELWIRGRCVMQGYYREPQLSAEVLTPEGWLKTGDMVRKDERGRFSIVGRKKDMLKVAGEIVFCPEVEAVIHRHPSVQDVAVVGIPDSLRGEVPKAFIVLKPGESVTEGALRDFLKNQLAHFKIPHAFAFRSELPKNRLGKIDKEQLKRPEPESKTLA